MLLVKTKLGISNIPNAGIGLFADQDIKSGTKIWEYNPNHDREYNHSDIVNSNSLVCEFLTTYTFKYNGYYYLCIDNARFFNHSDNPNCESKEFTESNLGYTVAKRDIKRGEELTDDYSKFGITEEDKKFNINL